MKRRGKLAGRVPAIDLHLDSTMKSPFVMRYAKKHWRRASVPALWALALLSSFLLLSAAGYCESTTGSANRIYEDFASIEGWEDFYFPKIKQHTLYSLGKEDGVTFLIANSSASASAFMLRQEINVYETPVLRWRWKTDNVYKNGDLMTKRGDDSPLRIYIMFRYDPARATVSMKLKYGLARAIYGQYPPHASLNYVWASRAPVGSVIVSAYTDRSRMIVMRSGQSKTGMWLEEQADILADYRRAFGEAPPGSARIAVMNDSDNTGESALSYIDYIELYGPDIMNSPGP